MANATARSTTIRETVSEALTSLGGRAVGAISDGVTYIADLLRRIVSNLKALAPMVFAAGCQSGAVEAAAEQPAIEMEVQSAEPTPKQDKEPTALGRFNITFYYMIGEEEVAAKAAARAAKLARTAPAAVANDNHDQVGDLAAIVVPEMVTLYEGKTCKPITEVSKEFAAQLNLQGTGQLKDGRVINVWGYCSCEHSPCFKVTDAKWGTSGSGRPLQPFRTVAVDPKVVKLGSLLYVPLLEGRTMPGRAPWGGFVHDGCVVADDTGGGIDGHQLDLFVARKGYYLGISGSAGSHSWARKVPVFDGSKLCERRGRIVARKAGAI